MSDHVTLREIVTNLLYPPRVPAVRDAVRLGGTAV